MNVNSHSVVIPEGTSWDTFVLDLMRRHWDVRFISVDARDAQKLDTGTSPFSVAHQRGGIVYLGKDTVVRNRPKEIGHEFGHAVHWMLLGKPPGDNYGLEEPLEELSPRIAKVYSKLQDEDLRLLLQRDLPTFLSECATIEPWMAQQEIIVEFIACAVEAWVCLHSGMSLQQIGDNLVNLENFRREARVICIQEGMTCPDEGAVWEHHVYSDDHLECTARHFCAVGGWFVARAVRHWDDPPQTPSIIDLLLQR